MAAFSSEVPATGPAPSGGAQQVFGGQQQPSIPPSTPLISPQLLGQQQQQGKNKIFIIAN